MKRFLNSWAFPAVAFALLFGLLASGIAIAAQVTDQYGRVIVQDSDRVWHTSDGGLSIGPTDNAAQVLSTANGMAPPGSISVQAPPAIWTFEVFFARFTDAEQQAIFSSADWRVKAWIARATGTRTIDPADPLVLAGLNQLVALGLLTSGRPAAILTP